MVASPLVALGSGAAQCRGDKSADTAVSHDHVVTPTATPTPPTEVLVESVLVFSAVLAFIGIGILVAVYRILKRNRR